MLVVSLSLNMELSQATYIMLYHCNVVDSAGDVMNKKGYTNWAVGLAVAHIAKNVLDDTLSIMTVSTCVRGLIVKMMCIRVFCVLLEALECVVWSSSL
jgi:malate/lactate dehydrogenase